MLADPSSYGAACELPWAPLVWEQDPALCAVSGPKVLSCPCLSPATALPPGAQKLPKC